MNLCPHCQRLFDLNDAKDGNCPECGEDLAKPAPPSELDWHTEPKTGLAGVLQLWFGLSRDVGRFNYAATGFGLMIFKYGVEAGLIYALTERFFPPWDFVNPLLSVRQEYLKPPAPEGLGWLLFLWTLPFLWIAVSMSVRRSVEAAGVAWLGLMVLVPGINLVAMLLLCMLPDNRRWASYRLYEEPKLEHGMRSALIGIVAGIGISVGMLLLSVGVLGDYGASLFLGTPILVGAMSAYLYNRPHQRTFMASLAVAELSILLSGMATLLFALEGAICLIMLLPVAAVLGLLGGMIGYVAGTVTADHRLLLIPLVFLPAVAGMDHGVRSTPEYEVSSSIVIDAPPEKVWPHVVGFSELPAPPTWYFRLGIAYPTKATIDGTGVGAVRRCQFSTGDFVEPITVWDEPRHLAFDVQSQPPPMHELSPYKNVHPPHLDGYLRCQRGEFRLVRLPDGKTRLEGSTWYEFEMYPQDYWTLWSDLCIHRIHMRVLNHIKSLSESS